MRDRLACILSPYIFTNLFRVIARSLGVDINFKKTVHLENKMLKVGSHFDDDIVFSKIRTIRIGFYLWYEKVFSYLKYCLWLELAHFVRV